MANFLIWPPARCDCLPSGWHPSDLAWPRESPLDTGYFLPPRGSSLLKNPRVSWQRLRISHWYGQTNRLIEVATGTALWYHAGIAPVPIRWIIVRDPTGKLEPQAFLCTDLNASPTDIIAWFVARWNVEVTFQEVRAHPWRGNSTSMVRQRNLSHHSRIVGIILHHHSFIS